MYQVYMVFFSVRKLSILKIKTYLFACEIIFGQIIEYCEQIEPPVRMIEPASAINRATQCNRESH